MQETITSQNINKYPFSRQKAKLQKIFLDNHNWDFLKPLHPELLNEDVAEIVDKALSCGLNGGITYYCPSCGNLEHIGFGCNSKFCTRCGKRMIDTWPEKVAKSVLKAEHRHWILTMDSRLWPIVDGHRHLLDILFNSGYEFMQTMMTDITRNKIRIPNKMVIPGMLSALHTSGRGIAFKPHLHSVVTEGGLFVNHRNPKKTNDPRWIKLSYFHFDTYRILWKDILLDNFLSALPFTYFPLIEQIRKENTNGFDIRAPKENIIKNIKPVNPIEIISRL